MIVSPRTRQAAWFITLYVGGVLAVFLVAGVIHLAFAVR